MNGLAPNNVYSSAINNYLVLNYGRFKHNVIHTPRPWSTGTFSPVPNHCTFDTTIVEYVHTMGSRHEYLTWCTCAQWLNFVRAGEGESAREDSVRVRGHQVRYTCVQGVKCVSGGEGVRVHRFNTTQALRHGP